MGPGQGRATSTFDDAIKKDVLKFDYAVPHGSTIGVWSKSYPRSLSAEAVDAVSIGVGALHPDQKRSVFVKLEIKGHKAVQHIPLPLSSGWSYAREPIDWNTIGELREVVLVVRPIGDGETAEGSVLLDLTFYQLTFLQQQAPLVKIGLVIILSLLGAGLTALASRLLGRRVGTAPGASVFSRVPRDLLYGVAAVAMGAVALSLWTMGAASPLESWSRLDCLAFAVAGAAIAAWLKLGLTGKTLTPSEVFQSLLVTGLLAVASSRQALLQAPSSWAQLVTFSHVVAVLAFLIYHISNACSLASTGKPVRAITGALMVGTPYLFNWLLLLQQPALLQTLGHGITAGLLANRPAILEMLGRLLVVFSFNAAVTNGISLATRGKVLRTSRAYLFTLLVSVNVIVAPVIAQLGSTAAVGLLPAALRALVAIATAMLSFAGLWGEVYLITGVILDGIHRAAPTRETITTHVITGTRKGMAYSGLLMGMLYALLMLLKNPASHALLRGLPMLTGIVSGAAAFPFLKTIIETFDGSQPFGDRMRHSYRDATLYARGAVAGFGGAYALTHGFVHQATADRMLFGLLVGLCASAGVSLLRDGAYAIARRGRIQSWRLYVIDALLGGFVGSAAAFYLDAAQVPVVVEKFRLYTSAGFPAVDYVTYPLVNKWGRMDLGSYTGGAQLLFFEALAGVINWSIAAWLFAINKVFLEAFFQRDRSPIRFFFSKAGFVQLIEHMLYVLRWGLWMSPIIFTFLRMMPEPTWYNQDGMIRTLAAIGNRLTMTPEAFREWSLQAFTAVLAFDAFRVLIWMDHMGLRVATLVNLSFIGMDRLDERIARFIGPASAQRYIPEAVKRFTTWAPLLIPFYIPRGEAWDRAWSVSEGIAMRRAAGDGSLLSSVTAWPWPETLWLAGAAILVCTGLSCALRAASRRWRRRARTYRLGNRAYTVALQDDGGIYSCTVSKEHDVSRRTYDILDPCGRVLYLVDTARAPEHQARAWPVIGNFPSDRFAASRIERHEDALRVVNTANGIRATIEVTLPDAETTAELWTVTVENLTSTPRRLKALPYLEWTLTRALDDRFHTQYHRLFLEMEYARGANAILAWQRSTKAMGVLASDVPVEGFLTSRVDFIGRARSLWTPRIADTLRFSEAQDTAAHPTFDPIGSLMVDVAVEPLASKRFRLLIGYAPNRTAALELIQRHLPPRARAAMVSRVESNGAPLIGHGDIPAGTPQPYFSYRDGGTTLMVHTPYTPRPVDHTLSNAVGHSIMVTNRGLHTSCNGNSQQNRLTPDWSDTVTREVPGEAFYLYDPDGHEWYSPTHHPLNDPLAANDAEFGLDGTAVFRMTKGTISTELTVFVPPDDPVGVYLLTVRNHAAQPRRMRIAPYFQMTLAFQPERSGPLGGRFDAALNALWCENPRNTFRTGPAFVTMSLPAERAETRRGRFFGTGRGVAHPFFVEQGAPDATQVTDDRPVAAFLGTVEIPAQGERTIAVILGQTDRRAHAVQLIQRYRSVDVVRERLEHTRSWWLRLMGTVEVQTNVPEFDQLQHWLKYQAVAERLWARRGFYQTSGAFGFRDQLQDAVNLLWVDPSLARRQILLHAAHQFLEGDVFHWFFTLTDGRTAFACRSHASDNPLWLVWGVAEYLKATGDASILDEMVSYVVSENPFAPLPKNKQGWGGLYQRSTRADAVYRHCLKSLDLVLERRMGRHGLPLMGTGDWNDGLDEIGSEGNGESVWLGFFLHYILKNIVELIGARDGERRKTHYLAKLQALEEALERTWRGDRYLRAIHDDGTEIGVKDSGVWEIDALTAAWAVMCGINPQRGRTIFHTALNILEKEDVILLGWPALREDTTPYLGRSSKYPEGVRENGMYCHGVQWLIRAARILANQCEQEGDGAGADAYRQTAYRLWRKITPIPHVTPQTIECYGGQPNKQPADLLTTVDPGRMIWHGYTGAAGWLFRQALEGVIGASLIRNELILPADLGKPRGDLQVLQVSRTVGRSPLNTAG